MVYKSISLLYSRKDIIRRIDEVYTYRNMLQVYVQRLFYFSKPRPYDGTTITLSLRTYFHNN